MKIESIPNDKITNEGYEKVITILYTYKFQYEKVA